MNSRASTKRLSAFADSRKAVLKRLFCPYPRTIALSETRISLRGTEAQDLCKRSILLDLNSGDYEIAEDDLGFEASAQVRERHPNANLFGLRIGYEAVDVIGGILERLDN